MIEKLSKHEIEALIPDYIFGNLNEEERANLEISIIDYPDLEQELQDGLALFARIDRMDFDKILSEKTDYLPERVVNSLKKRDITVYELKKKKHKWILPFAVAATAAFLVFLFVVNPYKKEMNREETLTFSQNSSNINSELFTALEQNIIYDEFEKNQYITELNIMLDKQNNNFNSENYDEEDSEIYNSILSEFDDNIANDSIFGALDRELLIEDLENMNEEDFLTIMDNI